MNNISILTGIFLIGATVGLCFMDEKSGRVLFYLLAIIIWNATTFCWWAYPLIMGK